MLEAEHNSKNSFVKSQQEQIAKMAGKNPSMDKEYGNFDACMMNNGEHAQEFARDLTSGLDKKAFPVK